MIAVLGVVYRDSETGFIGKATSLCFNLHSADLAHLENSTTSRWIEFTRLEELTENELSIRRF